MEFTDGIANESGTVTTFNYSADNNEFTGKSDYFVLVGSGLPARSTLTSPPELKENQQAVWKDNAWSVVSDYRGQSVYSDAGDIVIWNQLGDLPAGYSLSQTSQYYVAAAESEKKRLLAQANSVTQAWQTQLMLGIITDADKVSLTTWMKYYQQVQALDTTKAPDIVWPEQP